MRDPDLAARTDICVKCGLCLPHCPTYLKTRDENESPRGRLALVQGWARSELKLTPRLSGHIEACVLCRACESVCPAYVPYGQIIDSFRNQASGQSGEPWGKRLESGALRQLLTRPRLTSLASGLLNRQSAVFRHLPALLGEGQLADGLPEPTLEPMAKPGTYPARGNETGQVSLFLGCTAELLDRETLASAIKIMTWLGYRVDIPANQGCCGALHQHSGKGNEAGAFARQNLEAFGDREESIVSFASGCTAMLKEYGQSIGGEPSARFSLRIKDISQFLAACNWPAEARLEPLPVTVCVHSPCSLRNVLKADRHAQELLRKIPELNIESLPAQTRCCGAGGNYQVTHPEMAGQLRDDVLDQITAIRPALLATSNPGCAMHLRAGLKQRGLGNIEVVHPITLLARQITV